MDGDWANSEIAPLSHLNGMFAAAMTFTTLHVLQHAGNAQILFHKGCWCSGKNPSFPVFH